MALELRQQLIEFLFDGGQFIFSSIALLFDAGRNIGERIAEVLAEEGAKIAVVDLDQDRADQVTKKLTDAGRDAAQVLHGSGPEVARARPRPAPLLVRTAEPPG